MKRKYFGWEQAFEFIWHNADRDGIWDGNDATLAAEFAVSEDEAHAVLRELRDRNLIQKLGSATYVITKWRDREESAEEESSP